MQLMALNFRFSHESGSIMLKGLTSCFCVLLASGLLAQTEVRNHSERIMVDGRVVPVVISGHDTLYISDLPDVSITSQKRFASNEEYALYQRYRRHALIVYPYAVDAIRIFRELQHISVTMKPAQQRKHIRRLQKELKEQFEDPLKGLTRTQGKILVHMIEKELDSSMFELIKMLKGGITANYWQGAGKLYGYNLRKGYIVGEDQIMDMILDDLNVSHKIR